MTNINNTAKTMIYNGIFDSLNHIKYVPKDLKIWFDEADVRRLFSVDEEWHQVAKTLGNIKGFVSVEDRQLLKIVHNLSDKQVDNMISEYQKQYKIYLKGSKLFGKESWRNNKCRLK